MPPAIEEIEITPKKDFKILIPSHEQGKGIEIDLVKGVKNKIPKNLQKNMETEGVI